MALKICALTMVYRDYWALSRWYAHHGAELGAQNLFVINHGDDPKIAEICPGAQILPIERVDLSNFDRARSEIIDQFHAELAREYDWVIRTDADELLLYDPDQHESLVALFAKESAPVLTALGFDLVEMPRNAPMARGPVCRQRRNVLFTGHYSKAVAARGFQKFRLHGVEVAPEALETFPYHMPRGFYLAHLKYANLEALSQANVVRREVVAAAHSGKPGRAWAEADDEAMEFLEQFHSYFKRPWEKAEAKAYARLSVDPARVARSSVVRAQKFKPTHRTKLPDRFAELG
ncbi:glycosyltransferase family 2 protein [Shimia aestuarii]|uniref:glycosyltransferase family 2 protein n=1 Tax=Shimia aestuarii TaxID=254406 RepID=UPI001FB35DE8|nr:glycosyltransferase family 2 protein [Shimia aestuarii]